jgi:multicomponent Na+:H+ antiporter subunit D
MSRLVPLPLLLPLIGAAVSILTGRSRTVQRIVGVTALTAALGVSVALLVEVDRHGPLVARAGGWPAAFGITLVADRFSTIMLVVALLMLLAVLVYAIGEPGAERQHVGFQSVYLVLAAGVSLAFLTGDLFNLFVAFEMMLTASYVLLTLGGKREQVRSGMTYVVISLLASTLFVTALALLYSATGTLNMAELAVRMRDLPGGVQSAFAGLLIVVFGIKAALFPLFFWLPDSYPTAPSPITAVFAGLLTKVGIYAIIRSQTLFFAPDQRPGTLLLVLAGATMLVGIIGAIAQDDVKRILSFDIVSQVGYMVMGLALFTVAGLAGAVFYIVQHIVVKTTLFLSAGLIEHTGGTSSLARIGKLLRTAPFLAVMFLLPALSLAGIPPLSGFVAKFALVDAGDASGEYAIVAVSLLVSLLTVFVMMRIWSGVFWSPSEQRAVTVTGTTPAAYRAGGPWLMVAPTVALVIVGLVIAVAAGPLFRLSERTARDLLEPRRYVEVVVDR